MKKKTKKKIGKVVQGFFKLVIVYPIKGLWFILEQLYILIQDALSQTKKSNKVASKRTSAEKPVQTQEKEPEIGRIISTPIFHALREIKPLEGDFTNFQELLYTNKSTVGLIIGARGTGKSAIGMRILENFKTKTKKNIYALGFKSTALPTWITIIHNIKDIDNNSVLLIDEGGIEFSSRKSMSNANTLLSEVLLIARHKDLSVLFITQNSSNIEINVIRQADYLILKPSSLLQKDFERKKIQKIYEEVEDEFKEFKADVGLTHIFSNNYRGFVSNTLPSFWSEDVSKGYNDK
jgi:hypothetical protein